MKTYCVSDIHGHWSNFESFIKTLNNDDVVYILGDVIDKGNDSIKILQYVMNDKRFKMLLGNHEYMMFTYLYEKENTYERKLAYESWVLWNEGKKTLDDFNNLPSDIQAEIREYIKSLPTNYPNVVVNDKYFYLVHSCPGEEETHSIETLNYDDDRISPYVWDRVDPKQCSIVENKTVIAGHTPVQKYISLTSKPRPFFDSEDIKDAKYIDIDGGLATQLPQAKLIALCLDDLSYELY